MANRTSFAVLALFAALCCAAGLFIADGPSATAPATSPTTQPVTAAAMQILKQNCFACHNREKRKGGFTLTSRDAALKGGDNGPVILPGKPAESPLVQVLAADAETHMPPKKQLDEKAIAVLREWVSAGATWDERALADAAWDNPPPTQFRSLPAAYQPVLAIAIAPGDRLLALGRGSRVFVHDLTKPQRPIMRVLDGPRDAVQSLAWSADGDYGRVFIWEFADKGAAEDAGDAEKKPIVLEGLAGRATAMTFLADAGELIVADGRAGSPGRLHRFHLPETKPQITIDAAHSDSILALSRDKEGKQLASAGGDRVVRLWDLPTLTERGKLEGHSGRVTSVAFSPDGKLLASSSADRDMKVWDVKTRERKINAGPHPTAVTAIAWLADKQIAVACEDGTVRLNKSDATDLGRPMGEPAGDVLYCLAATADGKTLFAGCHDGQVYVWTNGKREEELPATRPSDDAKEPRKK
jgi:mono/diheme cytochrome c family protein